MALKKTVSSYYKEIQEHIFFADGNFSHIETSKELIPQRDIDLHSLEEAEVLARWAYQEVLARIPAKPTQTEEHEWLISHGSYHVKAKRMEWENIANEIKSKADVIEKVWREKEKAWIDHVEYCVKRNLDPDIYILPKK